MILNMVGIGVGGGAELNFDVVGNPKPDSPKENTIWLNTDVDITSWEFSPETPYRISKNKNLIVYPYQNFTQSVGDFDFTVYDSGAVYVNGTPPTTTEEEVEFPILSQGVENGEMLLQPGTYTLSRGVPSVNSSLVMQYSYDNWETEEPQISVSGSDTSVTFTITETAQATLKMVIASGIKYGTVVNHTYKPQLEIGSTATSFIKGDADGQVHLFTSGNPLAGAFEFNIFKENTLQVYLMAVKQVIGGVWTVIESSIYQSGAWVPIKFTLRLVPNVDNFPKSAWVANSTQVASNSYLTPTLTVNESTGILTFTSATSGATAAQTVTTRSYTANTKDFIDFTIFNNMTVTYRIQFSFIGSSSARPNTPLYSKNYLGFKSSGGVVTDTAGFNVTLTTGNNSTVTNETTKSYDISNITGNHKVHLRITESGATFNYLKTSFYINELIFTT